ncbi:rhodanese-like domain-containing protein [Jeotgalibaca caeni]|uniref:rhodanese-like domain-containing protein n=1 Tax=Jeotgalibaca caeni TaxID=3028623 RepID=UPI00237D535B|nr:rhodanese-like domain-containing protein [Jeotgalibaca caeni]MDE1549408.1 rhodanese-like domain-containing protein [Jeotgalibaca caeni]
MFFSKIPAITTKELEQNLHEKPVIIDVRTDNEFVEGHIPGAKNIPLQIINEYTPTTKCYVICESGMRSKQAVKQLKAKGYEVTNVKGGMRAWNGPRKGGKE